LCQKEAERREIKRRRELIEDATVSKTKDIRETVATASCFKDRLIALLRRGAGFESQAAHH
jgi:hypothetical protein